MAKTRNVILTRPEFARRVEADGSFIFEPEELKRRKLVRRQVKGRGVTYFFDYDGVACVLRHYWRGGFMQRLSRDGYLWLGLKRSRAFREWTILEKLEEIGLPAPRPVALRIRRHGWLCRSDIVTTEIENSRSLGQLLQKSGLDTADWEKIGRQIRTYCDNGVIHRDLNANNILLDGERVYLIDFDRACLCRGNWWKILVLRRLKRSLEKLSRMHVFFHYSAGNWKSLLTGYESL